MSKSVVLMLFALLALSSLVVGSVFSKLTHQPSIPEFTLKLEAHPYYVPPTFSINQYTGENVTIHDGHYVENKSIVVTIKNQNFSSSYYLFYNVRVKGHYGEDWRELYSYYEYSSGSLPVQSDSDYTVLSVSDADNYPSDALVDFQVEALLWHNIQVFVYDHPLAPSLGGHYETKMSVFLTSGWSDTQTLKIEAVQLPSPEPTSTPYKEPRPADQQAILGVAVTVAVIVAGLGLLVYRIKRK